MENPEEILHSLEEFAKLKPKDIPRELEEYLCFVAKTGDPVYQWSAVKGLFREKLISVITEFYESCPSVEIPPCPNVEMFNYDSMKNFILEKLDTFAAAPFTVQRICELLTTPRKEYNRIGKYMRALEKNILVVSTTEPGNRKSAENGEGIMNGLESEHVTEGNLNNDINVDEMDEIPMWPPRNNNKNEMATFHSSENITIETQTSPPREAPQEAFGPECRRNEEASTSSLESVITCRPTEKLYVSIEPVASESCTRPDKVVENVSVTITAIPAPVQKRRDSIEPVVTIDENTCDSEVNRKEETKENVKDSANAEKTNSEASQNTEETSMSTTEIVAQKGDDDLPSELQVTKIKISNETELPRQTSSETTASGVASENKPDTSKPNILVSDQVSELSTENSNSGTSLEITQDKQNTDCENPEVVAYAVKLNTDKTASADIVNNSKTTVIQNTENEVCNISLTNEDSLSDKSNESNNEQKEGSPTLKVPDSLTESHLAENVLDNPKELLISTENSEMKPSEETPMEIDLDEETTFTAISAPKLDSDTN